MIEFCFEKNGRINQVGHRKNNTMELKKLKFTNQVILNDCSLVKRKHLYGEKNGYSGFQIL